jgi:putative membrane protein
MRVLLLLLILGSVRSASAHSLDGANEISASGWSIEPWVFVPWVLSAGAYIAALCRLHDNGIRQRVVSLAQCTAFALGLLSLAIALMSPLSALSQQLFAAHMIEHLILMLVAPPLLVLGRPDIVLLWTFPLRIRRGIGHIWRKSGWLYSASRIFSQPVAVWIMASVAMWFWHIPSPYEWAFANPGIHIIEHMSFFLTSYAFWALALRPFSRQQGGHGHAMILLITFALESGLLGALLAFAAEPLYAVHISAARHLPPLLTNITPLQDQQLAGLIMWVPASIVQLMAFSAVFVDWLSTSRHRRLLTTN